MFLFFWIISWIVFGVLGIYFGLRADKRLGLEDPVFKKNRKKQFIFGFLFLVCLLSRFLFYFITGNLEGASSFFWVGLSIIFWFLEMYFCFCANKNRDNLLFKKYRKRIVIYGLLFFICLLGPFLLDFIIAEPQKTISFFRTRVSILFIVSGVVYDFLSQRCGKKNGMEDALYKKYRKGMEISCLLFLACFIVPVLLAFVIEDTQRIWIVLEVIFFASGTIFTIPLYQCSKRYGTENIFYKKYQKRVVISFSLFALCLIGPLFFVIAGIVLEILSLYYKKQYGKENARYQKYRMISLISFVLFGSFFLGHIVKNMEDSSIGFGILFLVLVMLAGFLSQHFKNKKKNGMEDAFYKKYRKELGISFVLFILCFISPFFIPEKADPVSEEKVASLENNMDQDEELEQKEEKDFSEESKEPETEKINTSEEQKEPEEEKVTSSEEPPKTETEVTPPEEQKEPEEDKVAPPEEPKEAETKATPPEEVQEPVQSEISGKEKRKQELEDFKTGLVENSDGGIISVEEYNEGIFQMTVSNAWYLLSDSEKQYFAEEMYSKFILYGKYAYDMDFISFTIYNESNRIVAESSLFGGMEIKE